MISTTVLIGLFVSHYVGDFALQTNWQALNKGRNWQALLSHTSVWAMCFAWAGWQFMLINFILHTITDKLSSQFTSKWWFIDLRERNLPKDSPIPVHPYYASVDMVKRKKFWLMIGFDQLVHAVTLIVTWGWLNG